MHAAEVINSALRHFHRWEKINHPFVTISFSDTVLFYQEPQGYGSWAFLDAYALAGMLLTSLLAEGIPARGAVAFCELIVRRDDDNRQETFCGRAFNEAYDAQEREKEWIGITLCQSAIEPFRQDDPLTAEAIEDEGRWHRQPDGSLLLNPFIKLYGAYLDDLIGEISVPYDQWNRPEFPNALRAFRFLLDSSRNYERQGDLTGCVAVKYHRTVQIIRDMLPDGCYEWAEWASAAVTGSEISG